VLSASRGTLRTLAYIFFGDSTVIFRLGDAFASNLFVGPGNPRLQDAVLSVLAGDMFRGTPLGGRLFAFKSICYLMNFLNPRRTVSAWKDCRQIMGEPNAETTAI
jgi:hypothetical protein